MIRIVSTYYWKELTRDGLLKEPDTFGAYYEEESLNGYSGFSSKELAYASFLSMHEKHNLLYEAYVLVEECDLREVNEN